MLRSNEIKEIKLKLSSSEDIIRRSYGEVTKQDTVNYRTHKAEPNGLFAENIFGPTKDYECYCKKLKKIANKGKVCKFCGVEITRSFVRRERMGHIKLATPIAHVWFIDKNKGIMSKILNMKADHIYKIVHFDNTYVVLDNNGKDELFSYKEVFDIKNKLDKLKAVFQKLAPKYEAANVDETTRRIFRELDVNLRRNNDPEFERYMMFFEEFEGIKFSIGAEALKVLLMNLDIDAEIQNEVDLLRNIDRSKDAKKVKVINRRLELLYDFKQSGNKPEWMILDAIPVLPPDLRPIIPLDGGRFTSSGLNDLYRKILSRNQKVKNAIENDYPKIITNECKRILQDAIDRIIDENDTNITNPKQKRASIISRLKSKKGRFRQNLLGKRVDYSGRSVIVVGPELSIEECGLPKKMALELFKPFIMAILLKLNQAKNTKHAKRMIDEGSVFALDALDIVIKDKVVLLNRAPTLHRLGIQAFYPKLVDGKAIHLTPLVCASFNADFDGDQMAVHLPITEETQEEAKRLMLASHNILLPKDGSPTISPSQDMILGNFYLTIEDRNAIGKGKVIGNIDEIDKLLLIKKISIHSIIAVPISKLTKYTWKEEDKGKYLITTPGKLTLNSKLPEGFNFITDSTKEAIETYPSPHYIVDRADQIEKRIEEMELHDGFTSKDLSKMISLVFERFNSKEAANFADEIKSLGFKYSTQSGISISAFDVNVNRVKDSYIKEGDKKTKEIKDLFAEGVISSQEEYNQIIDIWTNVTNEVKSRIMDGYKKDNPVLMMANSGARGNVSNFTQLVGIRGLMAKSNNMAIEVPIKSSFREGLTGLEFFISTHGSRKGTVDTALNTGMVGYLTRTLVDAAHDVIVKEEDCQTERFLTVNPFKDDDMIFETIYERVVGRFIAQDVEIDGVKVISKNELVTEAIAKQIEEAGFESLRIRSAATCDSRYGICQKCYGVDLSTRDIIEIGSAVGVIAAQSIGEPGTQLTMRTFHTGGIAGNDIVGGFPAILGLFKKEPKYDFEFNHSNKAKIGAIFLGDGQPIDKNVVLSEDMFGVEVKITKMNFIKANGFYEREHGIKKYQIEFSDGNNKYEELYTLSQYHILSIKKGSKIKIGYPITNGIIHYISKEEIQEYRSKYPTIKDRKVNLNYSIEEFVDNIIFQVQKVYRMQGIELSDKHFELIIYKMLYYVEITDPGDLEISFGAGSKIITKDKFKELCDFARENNLKEPKYRQLELGIGKEISLLSVDSFLDSASYERTSKMLAHAAIRGKTDRLLGLKENVMLGKLIPAGTGVNPDFGKFRK